MVDSKRVVRGLTPPSNTMLEGIVSNITQRIFNASSNLEDRVSC